MGERAGGATREEQGDQEARHGEDGEGDEDPLETVEQRRGVATSSVQFFRCIGGAVAVAALGALLNSRLQSVAGPGVSADAMLDPALRSRLAPATLHLLSGALLHGLQGVFVALAGFAVLGLLIAMLFPRGSTRSLTHQESPIVEV